MQFNSNMTFGKHNGDDGDFGNRDSTESNQRLIYVVPSRCKYGAHKLQINFTNDDNIPKDDNAGDDTLADQIIESEPEDIKEVFQENVEDQAISKILDIFETARRENVLSFLDKKKEEMENFCKQDLNTSCSKNENKFKTKLLQLLREEESKIVDTEMHKPIITPQQPDAANFKFEEPQVNNFVVEKDVKPDTEYQLDPEYKIENKYQQDTEFGMETENKVETEAEIRPECKMDTENKVEIETKLNTECDTEAKLNTKVEIDKEYDLETFCADFEKSLEKFITEDRFKTYRNELQLFIRTTINTISGNSVDEVKTKSKKLILLFSRSPISFKGNQLDCCQHPDALNFCLQFAAKTFISSGVVQVSSVSAAAFPIGAVIALIWSRLPTFGKLFLGFLCQKCPYVKPSYSNSQPEIDESYAKRCRALLMIYGAVIQIGLSNRHPHGMRYGWMWLSSKLRQSPDPFMSSNILQAFLQIISFKMFKYYKGQFYKILYFIKNVYLPMISKLVGAEGTKQPFIKFELFINETINRLQKFGNLIQPSGYIESVFI